MNADRDQKVRQLFDALSDIEPDEREPRLRQLRAELGLEGTIGAEIEREALTLLGLSTQAGELPRVGSRDKVGRVVAGRYEVKKQLGAGGMGEVYLAFDRSLKIDVALKFLPAGLLGVEEVRSRFRQEVLLARQVTHRNVVRIYDLTEDGAEIFLSMEVLEGRTLADRLKEGPLSTAEAREIGEQMAEGLREIHARKIVHRDLKPQNVFLEQSGRVVIMDFGIARDQQGTGQGLTRTGQMIGTPNYLTPEQVLGRPVTEAADVYSWGLILHEGISGKPVFEPGEALEHVARRAVEDAPKLAGRERNNELLKLVDGALEREPGKRPAAGEIVERLRGRGNSRRQWVVAAAAAPVLAAGAYWAGSGGWWKKTVRQPGQAIRVLIADIVDRIGDPNLEGTLESVLALALEEASFITIFQRVDARRIAEQMKLEKAKSLTPEVARLVAVREGIDLVVSGEVSPAGSELQLALVAQDARTGSELQKEKYPARTKKELLDRAEQAARDVRRELGDEKLTSQAMAAEETFSATSLEAAHYYAQGQEASLLGQWDRAVQAYEKALALDPELGRAWSGLAVVYRNLGQTAKALEYYQKSLANMNRMSERERFRTRGGFYVTQWSPEQALQEYQALVKAYPADSAGHSNLALTYLILRQAKPALEQGRESVKIYPKNRTHRNNLAIYALCAGEFEEALREANEVLGQDVKFVKAYFSKALALAGLGRTEECRKTWEAVREVNERGMSLGELGLGDLAAARGEHAAARGHLEQSIALEQKAGRKEGEWWRCAALAQVLLAAGEKRAALTEAGLASASGDEGTLTQVGIVLAEAGDANGALAVAAKLAAKSGPAVKHAAQLIRGVTALLEGSAEEGMRQLEEAKGTLDSWLVRYWLGRGRLNRKQFVEASSEFDLCHQRRGEALTLYIDDLPTYRQLVPLYFYRGQAEMGLNAKQGGGSLDQFLALRPGEEDAMARAARKMLGRP